MEKTTELFIKTLFKELAQVKSEEEASETIEKITERFSQNHKNFIYTEALKIYLRANNDEIALKALEILERAAQLS